MPATAAKVTQRRGNVVWVELGGNLKELRQRKGLTMNELAQKAQTGRSMIAKLEAGNRRLNARWIERLSKALQATPDEIVGGINLKGVPMESHARMASPPNRAPVTDGATKSHGTGALTFQRGNELFLVDFTNRIVKVGHVEDTYHL